MQPTSMLRIPEARRRLTSAMASALVSKNRPSPPAVTVHGQAKIAPLALSQRPDSAKATAARSCRGMRSERSNRAIGSAQRLLTVSMGCERTGAAAARPSATVSAAAQTAGNRCSRMDPVGIDFLRLPFGTQAPCQGTGVISVGAGGRRRAGNPPGRALRFRRAVHGWIGNLGALIGGGGVENHGEKRKSPSPRREERRKNPLTCDENVTPLKEQTRFL